MRIIFSQYREVFMEAYENSATIKPNTHEWIIHMMNFKNLFTTIFMVTLLTLIIVLLATDSIPDAFASLDDSTSESQIGIKNIDETQEKPAVLVFTTATPAAQIATGTDGRFLQEQNCSKCHIMEWIEQTHKSRTEWEATLVQMEKMGVSLSEEQKIILLDYLADTNRP